MTNFTRQICRRWPTFPPYACKHPCYPKTSHFSAKMFACGAEYFKNIENLLSREISLDFHSINQNWCSMLTDEAIFTCRRPSAISLTSGSWNRNSGNLLTVKKKFAWLADTLTQAILSCESQNDQRGAYLGPIIRKCGSTGKPEYTKANWKTGNFHAGQLQWPAVRLKLGNSQKPTKKPEVFSRLSWNHLRVNWNDLRQLKTDFFSRATCIDRLVIFWHSDVK